MLKRQGLLKEMLDVGIYLSENPTTAEETLLNS
jgi:hypothetical protein